MACHKKNYSSLHIRVRRRYGGRAAAGRWQEQCQGVGIDTSVLQWQRGVGGGGALAAVPVSPPTLMLCSVCFARLSSSCLACFSRLASGSSARDACSQPQANIGGEAAALGLLHSARCAWLASLSSLCLACFAWLALLGLLRLACFARLALLGLLRSARFAWLELGSGR